MADLVDYLRDKLARVSDPVCACPDCDVSDWEDLHRGEKAFIKGYDDDCPIHGLDGTEPVYRRREVR